ncbi:hypothetical protein GCM10018785_54840 [Streptomyces longispororuber]|uniref:Uncharacterized protein n=1 Tax=Streptomyces longispororuber TaxID=68230 RepID=A0A918ZZF5_9ACTN|nr:hypothetical protein GCM10018785_54840 [Streptomyces longispororuber]
MHGTRPVRAIGRRNGTGPVRGTDPRNGTGPVRGYDPRNGVSPVRGTGPGGLVTANPCADGRGVRGGVPRHGVPRDGLPRGRRASGPRGPRSVVPGMAQRVHRHDAAQQRDNEQESARGCRLPVGTHGPEPTPPRYRAMCGVRAEH